MYKYLPSKNFIIVLTSIILALLIALSISWLTKNKINHESQNGLGLSATTSAKVAEFMALDTDKDGLKDWEEILYKTDPKLADTDNDGTDDQKELATNRDPLKSNTAPIDQAPNDQIDPEIIAAEVKAEQEYKNLSATDKISRDLFAQYIATKKVGEVMTDEEKMMIIENVLRNFPVIEFKTYVEKDLLVVDNRSNETLRDYSNNLAQIIINNSKVKTETVDSIIEEVSNITNDEQVFEKTQEIFQNFTPLIEKNLVTISTLLKTPVPRILLAEHLSLLNSFQEIYESLGLMQKSAEDIIILAPLLQNYDYSGQKLLASLTAITDKIQSLNIKYSNPLDLGYQLFNVIIKE